MAGRTAAAYRVIADGGHAAADAIGTRAASAADKVIAGRVTGT
jgi:hypothetical protein